MESVTTTVSLTAVLSGLAAAITTYVSPLTSEGRVLHR